jgi:hypothetical protein
VSAQPAPFSADVADTLRSAWSHGAGKDLVADPGVLQLDSLGNDDGPQLTDLWPEGVGADIGSALAAALAPIRWDDWSAYNAHRPFPSARAKQAHSVHVAAGGVRARVDEVRIRLIDHEVEDPSVPPSVLVRAEPERLPGGYGPIRFAIATLEAGHVVGALVERFAERGFAVTRSLDCSDPRRPGLWLQPRRVGPSVPPAPWPRRCSGLDPCGLSPDPRPLPRDAWDILLRGAPVSGSGLRQRVGVRKVQGVSDGAWEVTAAGPSLVRAGEVHTRVARAFRAPPTAVRVSEMNVVWAISAQLCLADGPDAYPAALLAAGEAAQQVCRAAAAAGLFARPVRGVDEPDVEAALALTTQEDLLYTILIGRPRVHGFTYDLTPPAPPTPGGDDHDIQRRDIHRPERLSEEQP